MRCYSAADLERIIYRELLLAMESIPETLTLHIGHDVVQEPVGVPGIVERQDVGMSEPSRQLDLAQEAVRTQGGGQLRAKNLESDWSVVLQVFG